MQMYQLAETTESIASPVSGSVGGIFPFKEEVRNPYTVETTRIVRCKNTVKPVCCEKAVQKIPKYFGNAVSSHVIECSNHILRVVEFILKKKACSSTDMFASSALQLYNFYASGNKIRDFYIRAVVDLGYIIATCLLIVNTGAFNEKRFFKLQRSLRKKNLNIDIVYNKLTIFLQTEMPFIFATISGCPAYSNQTAVDEKTYTCYLTIKNLIQY
jgi:hypothetical protein